MFRCEDSNCATNRHQLFYSCPNRDLLDKSDETTAFLELFPADVPSLKSEFVEMIHTFIQAPYIRGLNCNPNVSDRRLAPMTWKTCAYTIHTIEILLRDANKPLLDHLSSRHHDCLETLVRILGVMGSTWPRNIFITSHALTLLDMIVKHSPESTSILQWDALGLLISLSCSMPSLFCHNQPTPVPTGSTLDLHILHLVLLSHVVKILATMQAGDLEQELMMDDDVYQSNASGIVNILKLLNKYDEQVDPVIVWRHVQTLCRPLLRCCILFYHFLTDVPAMPELTEVGGDTFDNMCEYLGLPSTPERLLDFSPAIWDMIQR